MTIIEARSFVGSEIARIERENPVGELRPWENDACPVAQEHWIRVQQRIALSRPHPEGMACCQSLKLTLPERTDAQKRATEANRHHLKEARASKADLNLVQTSTNERFSRSRNDERLRNREMGQETGQVGFHTGKSTGGVYEQCI